MSSSSSNIKLCVRHCHAQDVHTRTGNIAYLSGGGLLGGVLGASGGLQVNAWSAAAPIELVQVGATAATQMI